ncbi:HAD-superfamily subfamily IB hydrolase, TIGR01490 [Anaerosphaera aminiphila DSM 21120]|uniref:phosphoserine phosphatase n=1 Tax=Anaerosphaera aminiphila DSM 21120 TaxID=1120995 RepID=A0A1M5RQG3_9FIRM|nr:HAD-IB family hydrolase [Anaerosphaera aminiphila]SHH28537.1 HAD-superfamily subfamily IB hydrolase, TIGR01490 [Anaerosphaera aminiphila DSM 21120]
MKKIGAFFDIDGTIYREALLIQHFKKLMDYEVIDRALWYTDVKKVYEEWKKRYGDYEEYLETLAPIYLDNLKGEDRKFVNYIADQVIKTSGDQVYKYSRERLKWHKEKGHLIFFISGSPDFLVSRIAAKYEATDYRGSVYKVDSDEKFTGELIPMWDSSSKNNVISGLIEEYDIDLKKSYAYGDTTGDLSMLKKMGNPIAINPNKALLESIKSNEKLSEKIKIIVERKDVIYSLDSSVTILDY